MRPLALNPREAGAWPAEFNLTGHAASGRRGLQEAVTYADNHPTLLNTMLPVKPGYQPQIEPHPQALTLLLSRIDDGACQAREQLYISPHTLALPLCPEPSC